MNVEAIKATGSTSITTNSQTTRTQHVNPVQVTPRFNADHSTIKTVGEAARPVKTVDFAAEDRKFRNRNLIMWGTFTAGSIGGLVLMSTSRSPGGMAAGFGVMAGSVLTVKALNGDSIAGDIATVATPFVGIPVGLAVAQRTKSLAAGLLTTGVISVLGLAVGKSLETDQHKQK